MASVYATMDSLEINAKTVSSLMVHFCGLFIYSDAFQGVRLESMDVVAAKSARRA